MFPVLLVFLVLLVLAAGVVVAVALPHLRAGAPVLTPQGEHAVREARTRLTNGDR